MVFVLPPALAKLSDSPSLLAVAVGVAVAATTATVLYVRRPEPAKNLKTRDDGKPLREAHALPHTRFFVGDLLEVAANFDRFHDWMADTSKRYDYEPWRLRVLGQNDAIVLATPAGLEAVFATHVAKFPRGEEGNKSIADVFGKSLLSSDGDDWLRQRKTAAKFFTAKALRICMTTTMHKNVQQLYGVMDQHMASGVPLDLSHLFGQFALQTFTEVGLGVDLRWIGTDVSVPIEELMRQGTPVLMRRSQVPVCWWKLEKYLNFGPEGKLHQLMATSRAWLQMVIDKSLDAFAKRQQDRTNASTEGEDETVKSIIELFFEHSQEDTTGLRSGDMVDFILTFVLAAQDTSSVSLTRFFLMLTNHPQVAARVRQEMASVLPPLGVTKDTYLTTDHIQHLVYLEATIHEVLRLYPTVPMIGREAQEDTIICGDLLVRKGNSVYLQTYAMARNPDVWGPDAAEFKPERWIDSETGELLKFPPTKFSTFGAGPHLCIGMKLAMLELRVVTANLVHRYALPLAVPNDGDYLIGVSLMMKKPLMVKVQPAASDV